MNPGKVHCLNRLSKYIVKLSVKLYRILHGGGLTDDETLGYIHIVHCNTLQIMLAILRGMGKLKIDFSNPSCVVRYIFIWF